MPDPSALATHRTGYRNSTTSGWAARCLFAVGGVLYLVALDTSAVKIRVYKGTGGEDWEEQDAANAVTHAGATLSYDAYLRGTTLYVFYRTATNTGRVRTFSTANDTWGGADVGAADVSTTITADRGVSLIVRADGDVLLLHTDSSSHNVNWARYEGASWAITMVQDLISSSAFPGGSVVNDGDAVRAVYWVSNAAKLANLTSDNTATQLNLDSSGAQMLANFPAWVDDGGTTRVASLVRDSTGEADFHHDTPFDDVIGSPNPTIVADISPTTTTDPGNMGGVVVPYDGKWHVLWSGDGRGEIHMDISDDYASPAFGVDTNVVTGLTGTDPAVFAIPTETGVPVAYTDLSGPSVGLMWAVGQPAVPASTPAVSRASSSLSVGF